MSDGLALVISWILILIYGIVGPLIIGTRYIKYKLDLKDKDDDKNDDD